MRLRGPTADSVWQLLLGLAFDSALHVMWCGLGLNEVPNKGLVARSDLTA